MDLNTAYPNIPDAIWLMELDWLGRVWECCRQKNLAPPKVVEICIDSAKQAIAIINNGPVQRAFPQMSHPEFLKYVAAKLGAM